MPIDEIVDLSRIDVAHRRQVLLRVGVPLFGVVLVILSILGISLYSYQANRAGALTLSNAVISQLQARITAEVSGYLSPATQAAFIARDMVARHAVPDGRAAIEGFAASMLSQVPHLEGFYAANGNGDFIMVRRDPKGGTVTKLILNLANSKVISSLHLDAAGRVLDQTVEPQDDFDPRKRSWYQGALQTDGIFWSSPYVFYTTHQPGITAAIRFTQAGSVDRVYGVDITLAALSEFLATLHIGRSGHTAIVDGAGNIIAAPELAGSASATNRPAVLGNTATLRDPALSRTFDRYRIDGYGNRTLTIGGRRFVTTAARVPAAGQNWVLLIAAPEADFTAFAGANSRQNLLLSLITIVLAGLLGLLLIRQNRRTDRIARLLSRQREIGARETRALSALATHAGLFDPAHPAPVLTESLAELSAAHRTSIWRLSSDGRTLRCEDQFDRQDGHVDGLELLRSEMPHFFAALDEGKPVEVANASADARTAEMHRLLMRGSGTRALSMVPVRGPSGISGAVLIEDAKEAERAHNFAWAVASIAAIRIGEPVADAPAFGPEDPADDPAGAGPSPAHGPEAASKTPVAEGNQPYSSALMPAPLDPADLAASFFPSVAAMIIRFDDAISLARRDATGMTALADEIAKAMQAIGTRYALPYMKLTGHHLVAAAGCIAGGDDTAAIRLADAAIAARDSCLSLLAQSGFDPVFRIGLDFGSALGCSLGQEPRLFNLWGDVIRSAELMAHSATDAGSIQVSEGAYMQLRQDFLFRARGVFYVPRMGTARTFILAGRR